MAGGAGREADINAALVAQAARGPSSGAEAQAAPSMAAAPSTPFIAGQAGNAPQLGAQQPTSTLFSGANPYRQASPNAYAQQPALSLPGFQGVQNPFYTAPSAQAAPTAPASNLGAQYQAYSQAYGNKLSEAKAANQAQLAAMQKAYQDKMAADKARAEAAAAEARRQELLAQQQYSNNGDFSAHGYAEGGITSLMGRK
jgi:hypothetical protein